jgi:hypothetical protein
MKHRFHPFFQLHGHHRLCDPIGHGGDGCFILPLLQSLVDRGRDRSYERPPAQIPACGITALGSCLGSWRRIAPRGKDAVCGRVAATIW